MMYVIIILLIIAAIMLFFALTYVTIDIKLKDTALAISVGNILWKKHISLDLFEKKEQKPEKPKKEKKQKTDKKSASTEKISSYKDRIFSKEKGIDFDELKNIKNEINETYSSILGIIKTIFGRLKYKVQIPVLNIELEYGTGDAATTGMLYGSIWGLVGTFYPIISSWAHMTYPALDITPDFYGKRFHLDARSIIKVRPAHIISAMIRALLSPNLTYLKNNLKTFKKGSVKNGR